MEKVENPIVSIIVPVYNVSPYLKRCVDSLINQTLKEIEIILINDGSTDDSGEICDKIAKEDNRIIVIHKENGGVSSARNAGLDIAKGKYISFVDSDDFVQLDMMDKMSRKMEKDNAEIVICNAYRHKNGEIKENCLGVSKENLNFEDKNIYEFFSYFRKISPYPWNKMFRKEIIDKIGLSFTDMKKVHSEDQLFIICYFRFVKTAAFIDESLYNYEIHIGSLSRSNVNYNIINQWINLIKEIEKFMAKYDPANGDKNSYKALMWSYFVGACSTHLLTADNFYTAIKCVSKENLKYLKLTFLSVALGKVGTIISKNQRLSFKARLYFRFIALLLLLGKYDRPLNTFLLSKK